MLGPIINLLFSNINGKQKCHEKGILKDKSDTSDAKFSSFYIMSNIPLIFEGDGFSSLFKNRKTHKMPM